jgi:hypothetical protein
MLPFHGKVKVSKRATSKIVIYKEAPKNRRDTYSTGWNGSEKGVTQQ